MDSILVDCKRLREFVSQVLQSVGVSRPDAEIAAEVQVRTDARGVLSHGTWCLPGYVRCLQQGGTDPQGRWTIVRETAVTALVDGGCSLGQVVAHHATELAMQKARKEGVGVIMVRNSSHFGAAGHYALMCAEKDSIGWATSNGGVVMAATGGRGKVIGNGPTAYGVPTEDGMPIVMDIAMSRVAGMKISIAHERGVSIPEGWVIDAEGRDTTNPADFFEGGALLPIGKHKGYALALLPEILAGALTGAAMTQQVTNWVRVPDKATNTGHTFIVLNVETFMPLADFKKRVQSLTNEMRQSDKMPGVDRIYVPGEMEHEKEAQARKRGLPLPETHWRHLHNLAQQRGLETQFLGTRVGG